MKKIPKIIHYVWVGTKEKDELFYACLDSWKEHLSDYKIIEWNEDTFDIESNYQVMQALKQQNYAYASDIIRVWALKEYGGIYFDTDLLVKKNLDHLLKNNLFLSYESKYWLGSAVIGAIPNHPVIDLIYKRYDHSSDINFNTNALTVHAYTSALRYLYDFKPLGITTSFNKILLLSNEYFYPINYMSLKKNITDNTLGVHYYKGSWHNEKQLRSFNFAKFTRKIFGKHIFSVFERIVARSYNKKITKEFKKIKVYP